jgi:hypothetical protein
MTISAAQRVVTLIAVVVSAQPAVALAADPFTATHARRVEANTYQGFSIRFQDGRRVFHAREPISIELVYARHAELSSGPEDGPESLYRIRLSFDRRSRTHWKRSTRSSMTACPAGNPGASAMHRPCC